MLLKNRHPDYNLVPAIIGRGGHNIRIIHEQTGAKIRVRGRGSGHLEVDDAKEANVPLMIVISADGILVGHQFVLAVQLVLRRLSEVNLLFRNFCNMRNLGDELSYLPFFMFGKMSPEAKVLLKTEIAHTPTFIPSDGDVRAASKKEVRGRSRKSAKKKSEAHAMDAAAVPCTPGRVVLNEEEVFTKTALQVDATDAYRCEDIDSPYFCSNGLPSQPFSLGSRCDEVMRSEFVQTGYQLQDDSSCYVPTSGSGDVFSSHFLPHCYHLPHGSTCHLPGAPALVDAYSMGCWESDPWSVNDWQCCWTENGSAFVSHPYGSEEFVVPVFHLAQAEDSSRRLVEHPDDQECDDDPAALRDLIASEVSAFLRESGARTTNKCT